MDTFRHVKYPFRFAELSKLKIFFNSRSFDRIFLFFMPFNDSSSDIELNYTDKKILERDRFQSHCHLSNFEFGNISVITHYNFIFFVSLGLFSFFEQQETL